jgi:hypothetical protein
LSKCDAGRLRRQIEERYPGFGNQFFPQQNGGFQFPNFNQFNQFPNNQFPNNNQQFQNNQQFNNQRPNNNQQPQNNNQQFNNQRPNNNQQPQNNNQQFNNQRPNNNQQITSTQPPTTLSPSVQECRDGCTTRTTSEYNPVCGMYSLCMKILFFNFIFIVPGTDNQNYHNQARLGKCVNNIN